MARNVRILSAGVREQLVSPGMRKAIDNVAAEVAKAVDAQGLTASSAGQDSPAVLRAEVESEVTDRARARVVVKHPAAMAMQAKHGMLTKAAAAAGLTIKSR